MVWSKPNQNYDDHDDRDFDDHNDDDHHDGHVQSRSGDNNMIMMTVILMIIMMIIIMMIMFSLDQAIIIWVGAGHSLRCRPIYS